MVHASAVRRAATLLQFPTYGWGEMEGCRHKLKLEIPSNFLCPMSHEATKPKVAVDP